MERIDQTNEQNNDQNCNKWHNRHHSPAGKVFAGILVVAIGALLLAREMGATLPHWLFSWKMLLIAIGLFVGFKHSFRNFSWVVLILIGGAFLIEDFFPGTEIHTFFWPIMLMFIGLMIIFKPRRRWNGGRYGRWNESRHAKWDTKHVYREGSNSSDDMLDTVSVFGGIKKNIISKDFKGGEVNCYFGGAEINLSQADINGTVILELNTVFGGAKLIVPPHWQVQSSDLVAVMGGIDDKRPQQNVSLNSDKVLVLKGTAVFGGIEILNY